MARGIATDVFLSAMEHQSLRAHLYREAQAATLNNFISIKTAHLSCICFFLHCASDCLSVCKYITRVLTEVYIVYTVLKAKWREITSHIILKQNKDVDSCEDNLCDVQIDRDTSEIYISVCTDLYAHTIGLQGVRFESRYYRLLYFFSTSRYYSCVYVHPLGSEKLCPCVY